MRFLLDHDVPAEIGRTLHSEGHDVLRVIDVLAPTATDAEVFDCARRDHRMLVTCNRDDFLALAAGEYPGLIILVRRRRRIAECAALVRLIGKAGQSGLAGNINFA